MIASGLVPEGCQGIADMAEAMLVLSAERWSLVNAGMATWCQKPWPSLAGASGLAPGGRTPPGKASAPSRKSNGYLCYTLHLCMHCVAHAIRGAALDLGRPCMPVVSRSSSLEELMTCLKGSAKPWVSSSVGEEAGMASFA